MEMSGMGPVWLTLPYPISANRYWATRVVPMSKGGRPRAITYVTTEAMQYRAAVKRSASDAGIALPIIGRLLLELWLYPHRPKDWAKRREKDRAWEDGIRCMDLGNCEKVMSDALQGTVILNDSSAWRIVLQRMHPDSEGARLVVRVSEYVDTDTEDA